jgi:hypothetical protein
VLKPSGPELIEMIPLREKPIGIEIDPHNTLLKEATVRGI